MAAAGALFSAVIETKGQKHDDNRQHTGRLMCNCDKQDQAYLKFLTPNKLFNAIKRTVTVVSPVTSHWNKPVSSKSEVGISKEPKAMHFL